MSNKTLSLKEFEQEIKNIGELASELQQEQKELIESVYRSYYAVSLLVTVVFGIIALVAL